jgi:hypothetical protein
MCSIYLSTMFFAALWRRISVCQIRFSSLLVTMYHFDVDSTTASHTMSQRPMLELTRPFARTSPVLEQLGGGLPRVDSPAMSLSASDSPGFSAVEESEFSGFGSSHGGVRHMGLGMPDRLEYPQVRTSSSHSSCIIIYTTCILTGSNIHEFFNKFPCGIPGWQILKSMLRIPY